MIPPLNWGVVATGRIAHRATRDLARLENAVLHAVSSRSQAAAKEFAGQYGFAASYYDRRATTGYQQLFDDPVVDVVYVATPHAQHFEVAKAALEAGKHVLCEKPLTVNARETIELVSLAGERKLFLMEAVWTRFLPATLRALELVRGGHFGTIRWVQADLGFAAPYDPSHRLFDPAAGGGALLDLTVYPLTWAISVLGFPATVAASGQLNSDRIDVQNTVTLGYADGASAQLVSSLQSESPGTVTISGTKGWPRTGWPLYRPRRLEYQGTDGIVRVEEFPEETEGFIHELREAARCIRAGLLESPLLPWEESLRIMQILDGVRDQLGVHYKNDR
ncbi:Gfo/Idh/MocA family oxidoreductase [Arthrobacter sp. D1-29]